ncbi:MAG: TonB-dependent receptor [Arenimonas sp.]|uniref:TonB-dependent receptor plug domain-containing protein n=1 Tax=Arenimonas sp. TaxID=1872635 RepID=UPI0025BE6D14|nr:TonB-dependent receptor [Arenimonas sp.]MBW8366534.1 TonB-dependent receptor [Arenimonas sp.]
MPTLCRNISLRRTVLATAIVSAGASAVPNAATAQDGEAVSDTVTLDAVQVTGSRLKRAGVEGATPVVVINRAQIDASGDISVAELLRDSTLSTFGNFKPQSGSTAQSLATVNLRGLGAGRTLVLVDGRRAPTNPMSASAGSDLNAIPLAAVDRIEILADGASAVYGSDAIGGVVNIILRKDFEGVQLRYGRGSSQVEGGDLEEMSMLFGGSGDRTRVMGGASSSKRGMVFTRDQIGGDVRGVSPFGNNYYSADTGRLSAVPGFSCSQGAFYVTGNGLCSFNFNDVAANEVKLGTKSLFLRADHQINERWNLHGAATVTRVESFGRYAPVPGLVVVQDGTPNDINGGVFCGDNPACATDGLPTYFYHRFAAAGNRESFTDATNGDFLLGFQGRLTDDINLDVGLRRTDYKYIELGRGFIVSSLADAAANSGAYDLSNPFGADPEVLAGLQATISREARWQTDEFYAIADLTLFEMGGGASAAVVGLEYRHNRYQDQYDPLSEAGLVLGSSGNSAGGDRDSRSVFFEWLLPFTDGFDITLAGRYDDYSDYGDEFSPKLALRWQPLENLTLRGSYGEGYRAPGLDILTQKPTFSAEPVFDPATCAALGAPSNCQTQVNTIFLANPNLDSERSEQYSLGLAWDPADWLGVSLDYYSITIKDTITVFTPQDIINLDLNPGVFGPIPPGFAIARAANGSISQIVSGYANRNRQKTDGLDLKISANFDLGGLGRMDSQLSVNQLLGYELNGLGFTSEFRGQVAYPEQRAGLQNRWSSGDFSVAWNVNYLQGQDSNTGGQDVGGYATNDLQVSWKSPWNAAVSVGATNIGDRYPELVPFDGRPWNFNLYDAYGRTVYLRYVQSF